MTSRETIKEILAVFASQFSNDAEALCRAVVNLVGLGKLERWTVKLKALETKLITKSLNVVLVEILPSSSMASYAIIFSIYERHLDKTMGN